MPLLKPRYKDTQTHSTDNVNRWKHSDAIPGAYNAGGTQTDANWNDAVTAAAIREPGHTHNYLTGAAGPHFGNFTGAQEPLPGQRTGYPTNNTHNAPPNYSASAQPADRAGTPHQITKGTTATVEPTLCPGPPPGPGTGAPAYGTGAGTHPSSMENGEYMSGGGSGAAVAAHEEEQGSPPRSKASFSDRLKGRTQKSIGKLVNSESMIEKGEAKKTGIRGTTQLDSFFSEST